MASPTMNAPASYTVKPLHSHTGQPIRCTPLPDAEFLAVVADLEANDDDPGENEDRRRAAMRGVL